MDVAGEKSKNQFKLIREIEDLGQSILHLGKFTKREEKVHVKISKKKYMSKDEYKYNKEIQALQTVNHRNVLKMFAAWIDEDNELRIVTEHLDTNVSRVMKKRNRPFTETETRNIMVQVFEGLNHVHTRNFMHRNIKPEALKCDPEANVIKIGDFTHALALDQKQMIKLEVKPLWYLAPEILLSLAYSTPVDIWAAGCVMAELLSGKPLFQGNNDKDQLKKICEVLGTFTRAEWPMGYAEAKTGDYSLPMVLQGSGLSKLNLAERSEAKPAIMSMLCWVPEKRVKPDACLRQKYFVDDSDKEDIMQDTQLKLQSWTQKWESNLDEGSINELNNIMEGLSPRKQKQVSEMLEKRAVSPPPRKPSTYQDQSPNQYSGSQSRHETPRASMDSSRSVALDEFIRSSRAEMTESRNSPQKEVTATPGMQRQKGGGGGGGVPPWMQNIEKKGSQDDLMDDPFRPHRAGQRRRNDNKELTQRSTDGMFPRRNPIAHGSEQDESGRVFDELDTGRPKGRKQISEKERKLLMWEKNKMQYRNIHGDDFMRVRSMTFHLVNTERSISIVAAPNGNTTSQFGQKPELGVKANTGNDQQRPADHKSPVDQAPVRKRNDDFHKDIYKPSWF